MVDASAANAPAAQAAARAAGKDAKNGAGAGASPPPTDDPSLPPPLIIPIQSGTVDPAFIEIFPEELTTVAASTLTSVLAEEDAALSVWSDAALAYVRNRQGGRGSELLQEACRREESGRAGSNNRDRVRTLAGAGIALLAQCHRGGEDGGGGDEAAAGAGGGGGGTRPPATRSRRRGTRSSAEAPTGISTAPPRSTASSP